jgi:hypothetical protein
MEGFLKETDLHDLGTIRISLKHGHTILVFGIYQERGRLARVLGAVSHFDALVSRALADQLAGETPALLSAERFALSAMNKDIAGQALSKFSFWTSRCTTRTESRL